ncbi:MAG: hypothetical protein ACXVHX_32110, partial [Solirubrobacteraceae bacterium]
MSDKKKYRMWTVSVAQVERRRRIGPADARGANRRSGSCKHQSGHEGVDPRTAAPGVKKPRSGRLATADADLPSLSYGHLVGD